MSRILVTGGLVIDGSGREPFAADVLIENDRIAQVAPNLSHSDVDTVLDAAGRIVAPGFIDIHSHYDAQVFWDPSLSSSCHHGVTSVVNGNCGFSLAPYANEHRGIVLKMLRDLEDMYTDTLEAAVPPTIASFDTYLSDVENSRPMLNFGSFIGHSTVRIAVMGPASYERAATEDEVASMAQLVHTAMASGAMGFATKTIRGTRPSPSQFATREETMTLLRAFGAHGSGVAMFNSGGNFDLEQVYATQAEIGRPFTWIALLSMPDGSHNARADMHRRWYERGADVRPQVSCRPLTTQCRLSMPSAIRSPEMTELNAKSDAERLAAYADPAWRDKTRPNVQSITGAPMPWKQVAILESKSDRQAEGHDLESLGTQRNRPPFDVLMDLAVADRLDTKVVITNGNGDPIEVTKLLNIEGGVLGLSDAGAHPAQTCDAVMPTDLLGNWVRERGAMPLEKAVHKLTQEPALLMGIAERGKVAPGYYADLVVFDPKTVGPGPLRTVHDLPMDRERLLADQPTGMHHMLVNGVIARQDERTLPARGGRVLRPN